MSQTFFTSDLHYGHANIIKYCDRPFESLTDMNAAIINNWNSVVKPEDTVYILGDVSFATPKETEEFLHKLNGEIHLILGNHDTKKYIPMYMNTFTSVSNLLEIKLKEPQSRENLRFTLCHYPMTAWNRSHHGTMHLYGHVHGTYDAPNLSMDVGIDTHPEFRPYSLDEILVKLYKKSICDLVKKTGKD